MNLKKIVLIVCISIIPINGYADSSISSIYDEILNVDDEYVVNNCEDYQEGLQKILDQQYDNNSNFSFKILECKDFICLVELHSNIDNISLQKNVTVNLTKCDYVKTKINTLDNTIDNNKNGWVYEDENTYYYRDGVLLIGFNMIDGETYYFNEDGSMYKGVLTLGEDKYLLGVKSGKLYKSGMATTPDGNIYYSDDEGKLLLGWQEYEGETYYFSEDGSMYKGFLTIDNKKYLFGFNSGKLYIGWATTPDKKIYYTNSFGEVQCGYQLIDGSAYLFDDNGVLQTGWQEINGKKYYFYADGTKAKYVSKIAGVRYEFSETGELQYSNVKLIIDISAWNNQIDWDALWNSGEIDGVILRIAAGAEVEDTMLSLNIANVKRLGIPYGIYIYSYAENFAEGVFYGNFTNNIINKYSLNPTLGVYLDLESNGITSYMNTQQYEEVVRGYMSVIPYAKIYTYTNYANTTLNSAYISQYITWIANYSVTERPGNYQGWQYTSKANVTGIVGNVDMSIFYY